MRRPLSERVRDSVRLRSLDLRDRLGGRSDRLVPPRRLILAGHADFAESGDALLGHLIGLGGLQPDEDVLDVGCGMGRMARPLSGYLTRAGSYEGFDVDRDAVGWCRRRYARLPNFGFQVADLHHPRLNPAGAQAAREFRFPFDDARFDFVILTSVLTHLLEDEATRHVAETARVLRSGGRALMTFFLLDGDSRAAIADGRSGLPFLDADAHVAVVSEELPEEAVAFDAAWVTERLGEHGLEPAGTARGAWAGREDATSFEDLVVARRVAA